MKKKTNSGNNIFKEKGVGKFNWVCEIDGSKNPITFVLVRDEEREKKSLNVNVFRSAGFGISSHYLADSKIKSLIKWAVRNDRIKERLVMRIKMGVGGLRGRCQG